MVWLVGQTCLMVVVAEMGSRLTLLFILSRPPLFCYITKFDMTDTNLL